MPASASSAFRAMSATWSGPDVTLEPVRRQIFLHDLEVEADIGFHAHEVGVPQRVCVSVEVTLARGHAPTGDEVASAWNYDLLREGIHRIARARRYNLQETLAEAVWALVADMPGVEALVVTVSKPDIYPDARRVGVRLSSI